jgi:antitoxin (DNA-binding transcriptional repressor) of toxin-antitoxin stability system
VTIMRRGKPVARLVPIGEPAAAAVDWSRSAAYRRRLPQTLEAAGAVLEALDENRGPY